MTQKRGVVGKIAYGIGWSMALILTPKQSIRVLEKLQAWLLQLEIEDYLIRREQVRR